MSVRYNAPEGVPGAVYLPGADPDRIRSEGGRETVVIYFASPASEAPINPQHYVPLWALIVFVTVVGLPVSRGVLCVRSGSSVRRGLTSRRRQRCFTFPVTGTGWRNAVMTAVSESEAPCCGSGRCGATSMKSQ